MAKVMRKGIVAEALFAICCFLLKKIPILRNNDCKFICIAEPLRIIGIEP